MRRIWMMSALFLSMSAAGAGAATLVGLQATSSGTPTAHQRVNRHKPVGHRRINKHKRGRPRREKPRKRNGNHRITGHRARRRHRTGTPPKRTSNNAYTTLFGDQSLEQSPDMNYPGSAEAFPFAAGKSGNVGSVTVYIASNSRARTLVAGLYSDALGQPGRRLGAGTLSRPRAGAWDTIMLNASIASGDTYWLAILGTGGTLRFRDRLGGPCHSENSLQTTLTSLPGTWQNGFEWDTCPISAYASGTVPGGSVPSTPPTTTTTTTTTTTPTTTTSTTTSSSSSSTTTTTTTTGSSTTTTTTSSSTTTASLPPANLVPPAIGGSPIQGQTLSASRGTWSGNPTGYAYQWEDCGATGGSCSSISGATASSYLIGAGDVGHELEVVVTASNPAGSSAEASLPTAAVATSQACTTTLGAGANIASAIAAAPDGGVICLQNGSYPHEVVSSMHTSYVTVEPAGGATASVAGIQTNGTSFLRLQGLNFTSGVDMRGSADHDIQVLDNDIGNSCFGVAISGNSGPVNNVLVSGNTIHNLSTANCGGSGYAAAQGVTINWGNNVTISYNTFADIGEHYIQGCGSPTTVDHNLFKGPGTPDSGAHLNIWQIWSGGSDCSFTNNVIQPDAADPISLIFENGPGGDGSATMSNITVSNNLFDHDATQEPWQIGAINGLTVTNNTVIGSHYGSVIQSEGGLAGSNYDIQHNIVVGTTDGSDFSYGGCSSSCTFDYNVSDDSSAAQGGSSHYLTRWSPSWNNTTQYLPIGLPFSAGTDQ